MLSLEKGLRQIPTLSSKVHLRVTLCLVPLQVLKWTWLAIEGPSRADFPFLEVDVVLLHLVQPAGGDPRAVWQ